MNIDQYLELAGQRLPAVKRTLTDFGDAPLGHYLASLTPPENPSRWDRSRLLRVLRDHGAPLWGETLAAHAAAALDAHPLAYTANHVGIEYFAQSLQDMVLFSLGARERAANGQGPAVVPAFSSGNVPMNNLTYPRGLLVYDADNGDTENTPLKIPVFPSRFLRTMSGRVRAHDRDMVEATIRNVAALASQGRLPAASATLIRDLLYQDYLSEEALAATPHARQAAIVNRRIWRRLFADGVAVPELIYLELEEVVTRFLLEGMEAPHGLTNQVLFDARLREAVVIRLNGARACWDLERLRARIDQFRTTPDARPHGTGPTGTLFFWAIDDSGYRIPLTVHDDQPGEARLEGVTDRGDLVSLSLTPDALREGLESRRLMPSLFTCFLALSFECGVTCAGGYFQAEYLTEMAGGLVDALTATGGYADLAALVEAVPTRDYFSGMIAILRSVEGGMIPAGPVEIITGGPLTDGDLDRLRGLTVREAHIAGLFETIPDMTTPEERLPGWRGRLAGKCAARLAGRVVER